MMKLILIITFSFVISVIRSETQRETLSPLYMLENDDFSAKVPSSKPQPLMVPLTLIQGADSKGAGFVSSFSLTSLCYHVSVAYCLSNIM